MAKRTCLLVDVSQLLMAWHDIRWMLARVSASFPSIETFGAWWVTHHTHSDYIIFIVFMYRKEPFPKSYIYIYIIIIQYIYIYIIYSSTPCLHGCVSFSFYIFDVFDGFRLVPLQHRLRRCRPKSCPEPDAHTATGFSVIQFAARRSTDEVWADAPRC